MAIGDLGPKASVMQALENKRNRHQTTFYPQGKRIPLPPGTMFERNNLLGRLADLVPPYEAQTKVKPIGENLNPAIKRRLRIS